MTLSAARARIDVLMIARLSALLIQTSEAAADAAADTDTFRSSPFVWIVAAGLLVAAVYFMIRLLELDLMNEETPNQDDPLS